MPTEKDKMLAGEPYNPFDAELSAERDGCRQILTDLNARLDRPKEELYAILRTLVGRFGNGAHIEPPFFCDYGYNIHLGDGAYLNFNCVVLDTNRITIGDRTLIGPAVQIYAPHHPLGVEERNTGIERGLAVTIGPDCWIGGGSIIVPGVTIGERTVVGAGSVVTRDLPPGVLAVGNPARVVRTL